MKKILLIAGGMLLGAAAMAQQAKHVVLITIDGFRPDFYTDPSWGMVNLRMMKEKGAYAAGVNSVFPSVTYPNHTSLITGVTPARHGIYYNTPFEGDSATGKWYWYYTALKTPTLYDAVRKAGKTSANVIWPVTVGAPVDYNIPDIWPLGKDKDRRMATAASAYPKGLWEEVQEQATGKITPADFAMENGEMIMDENVARMSAYLIRTYKPAFTTLHLACTDHYEHEEGRDGFLVRKAVAGADRALGTIVEALKRAGIYDSTAIIVTGDHGFVDIQQSFAPNLLLAQHGLLNDVQKGDWKAQFHTAGGAAFLYLKNPKDQATLEKVKAILKALPAAQQQLFKVLDRTALTAIGADPSAALALAAAKGVTMSGARKGELIKAAKGGTHGYYPDFKEIQTGFVAYGAGILPGSHVVEMNVTDVAPLIAQLLGLPFEKVDGKVPPGITTTR
ncbi:alkaline phosphatase family protein [Chitinophaga nivalis]|uniref:Ectonucleotide pyrophosphatase/phosphodiesterase n=1 Tax=Chitinophaga nivalis TaxID=2991709 RepID=A0ABT3IFH8_9BACT|nr:ectonucleotide pyrophosphatase/phosphodiesterase [Chitinophaga nivalis]MCW3467589.1 ectonucleotide pyrophosphatase/phosphodiesterase [Chitinophaga nivalis]MCW3482719.1 ectonucleotide pyrophosphatase/phosphodiesterase [Chitinophaga nivalis]